MPYDSDDFSSTDFYTDEGIETDPALAVMLNLKNNWGLTGDLTEDNIFFSTGWYDKAHAEPQISVRSISGLFEILETGLTPYYRKTTTLTINIWVRPKQDSNTSLGWAKKSIWDIKKEVERILEGKAHLESRIDYDLDDFEKFGFLRNWRVLDELNLRPVILRLQVEYIVVKYEQSIQIS